MEATIETQLSFASQPHLATRPACRAEPFYTPPLEAILTVIVPVYDEAKTIDELLRRVLASPYPKQVVVVNDASTDGTAEILERWRRNVHVEVFGHAINRGKGTAIRTGLAHARGKFVIVQDADLEYDPADYPLLIEPLLAGKATVVYGSRYLTRPGVFKERFRLLRLGVAGLNLAVRLLYGVRLTDEATCYKAFSTELLRRLDLQCERFEFCPEVTAKLCRQGKTILEVPIHYESRNIRAGKKLRWTDGMEALKVLWKYRRWTNGRPPGMTRTADDTKTAHSTEELSMFRRRSSRTSKALIAIGLLTSLFPGCSRHPNANEIAQVEKLGGRVELDHGR